MIKQPVMFFISLALLAGAVIYGIERLHFLSTASRTTGEVTGISAENSRCGGRRHRYACTKFQADVAFRAEDGERYTMTIGAGSTRGRDASKALASRRRGDDVKVVYDPGKPTKAYEDSTMGVWGGPLMTLFAQIITFFSSLTEPRRRRFGY